MDDILLESLNDAKCPKCGGPVNKMYFSHLEDNDTVAVFVAECWSGDLNKRSDYHHFLLKIQLQTKGDNENG